MLLTECAACGETLAHDAPRCVRCWTRYRAGPRPRTHVQRASGHLQIEYDFDVDGALAYDE
jgi:hypothetical protein